MSRKMTVGIDYTSRDYASIKQDMIDMLQKKIPEYTDTSETDAGIVLLECFAMGIDIVSFYLDNQANETMLYTCEQRKNALNWCRILGYTPQPTLPAKVMQVFTLNSLHNQDTIIPSGTVVKSVPKNSSEKILYFTTEEDLIIPANALGNETDSEGKYLYQVSAQHGITISNEILGTSNSSRNQKFNLSYSPVVKDSIKVDVKEDTNQWVRWTCVDDFSDSNADSRHYVVYILDNNQAQIQFGDGNSGRIPPNFINGIRVSYLNGGGTEGNITDNVLTELYSSNPLIKSTFNPNQVYELGKDKESLDSIKVNAPNYARIKWGALTVKDFEDLTKILFPNVLYSRASKDTRNIDDIVVYIMLENNEEMTEDIRKKIFSELDNRKVAGVGSIYVKPMELYSVNLECSLIVHDNYSRTSVENQVRSSIENYFAIGSFGISEDVSITDLESIVYKISGVKSFRVTKPSSLIIEVPEGTVVSINSLAISTTGGV